MERQRKDKKNFKKKREEIERRERKGVTVR